MYWETWQEDSPCDECKKVELHRDHIVAWELWNKLNEFSRGHGAFGGVYKLTTQVITDLCVFYGEGSDTFEKIIIKERIMYPIVAREIEQAIKNNSKK